ncbi:SGNH/GDSL hydrolase family protein [Microbulbifer hainanensis]|uniref:SGNH/GDSL hydrolase family protein n=1 Tax=Microbulbifer hainanensis TaxID=2735675 RepID=UPI001D032875|nr:SGNH/GDSL hydrolase family protein [Microbulbifer hainanensis]
METIMSFSSVGWHPARQFLLALLIALSPLAAADTAVTGNHWVATWTASPQPRWNGDFALPTKTPFHFWDQTLRQVVRVSVGGKQVRVELSNKYGSHPLYIGAAHLALAGDGAQTLAGSDQQLTFSGEKSPRIAAGATLLSDPVVLPVEALQRLSVSLYLPEPTPPETFHWDGRQTAYIAAGNQVKAPDLKVQSTTDTRVFLSGVLVNTAAPGKVVVAFGDSITDGNGATLDADHRWPDYLAARLAPQNIAVVNAGISGARLLDNGMGENALARFQRDVLAQPGVESAIVLMGINDIGWPGSALAPQKSLPTAQQLIALYRQLIARAHLHGVRILGATLTPFAGALQESPVHGYYSADKEKLRQQVNRWIRESGEFDAVVDFDQVVRDPQQPRRIRAEYDSGDHLHPGDAGNRAMADAIAIDALIAR